MAHDLSIRKDGFVEMAYTGEKPWHAMGQQMRDDASIEEWAVGAGMDWRIKRSKVRFATAMDTTPDTISVMEDQHVLFRSDSKAPLAIVSSEFKIVQPRETLEFFRDLVESAGYKLCTAGVLKGGRKFWAQAECGMQDNVLGNDVMRGKLLIATACDGSMKTVVKNVVERVVCANTLAIASAEHGREVKVSHKSKFNADDVKGKLGIAIEDFETFIAKARTLAMTHVTNNDAREFLYPIFTPTLLKLTEEDKRGIQAKSGFNTIMQLFNGNQQGANMQGVHKTAWGLVNAVTEYVDHHRGNAGTTSDNRTDYAWFGAGDTLKSETFDRAIATFA